MQVFLSWSGLRSRKLAQALHFWLKPIVQAAQLWLSDRDIDAGQRWGGEIATRLQETNFGIICVTPENVTSSWLLFEAGALAKSVETARVVPVLLDLQKAELPFPLAQFQAVGTDRDGMLSLVTSLNSSLGMSKLSGEVVAAAFDSVWPKFEAALQAIPALDPRQRGREPTDKEVLRELVEGVRGLQTLLMGSAATAPAESLPSDEGWEEYFTRGVDLSNRRTSGSDQAALGAYNQAIATFPRLGEPNSKARLFGYRGAILKRLNRLDEAMSDLRLAERLATERYEIEDTKYNIACVLAMTGGTEDAIAVIAELTRHSDDWKRVIRNRRSTYFAGIASDPRFAKLVAADETKD